jgi:hypothetical protein
MLSVTLMEVFWVFPWLIWLAKLPGLNWAKPPLSLLSLAVLLGISFAISKFFINRKWSLGWVRLSIVGCAIITIFIIIRAEYGAGIGLFDSWWFEYTARLMLSSFIRIVPMVVALVLSFCLWWRGINLGRTRLDANDIYRNFIIGIAALVLVIIVSGATLGTGFLFNISSVWVHLAGFFFFGLLAMALANLKSIQRKMSADGMSPALNRRWFLVLVVVIGGVVTTGIAIASTVSADFVNSLTRMLNTASDVLLRVLSYIYLPIGYLIEWLYNIGMSIVRFFQGENPEPMEMTELEEMLDRPEAAIPQGLPPELVLALKWLFFALVAAALIYLLSKAIFRFASLRERDEIDETHESLWSWNLFKSDLQLLLDRIRHLAPTRKSADKAEVLPEWYLDTFQGTLSVRQIYRCLLWEASHINMARRYYETPNEYAGRLYRTLPDSRELLDEITGLYIKERYGERATENRLILRANNLWKSLRDLLRGPENEYPNRGV